MGLLSFLKDKFAKKDSTNNKYSQGLEKSRTNFSNKISSLNKKYKKVNQDYFEQLEEILIESDIGVSLTMDIIDEVLSISKKENLSDSDSINEVLIDTIFNKYNEKGDSIKDISFSNDSPTALLVIGVNGVGKTTTIAKLANRYIKMGKKVLLVAADTFRAGAKEQLQQWAERLNCSIVTSKFEADPASVAYDGVYKAKKEGFDLVIIDTAGRLQNKSNLMMELSKIKRVISKEIPIERQETFLIIDATTGQNGVVQAKSFMETSALTGVVITKMDGTSKGGIILSIREELSIPVRFIGLGEGIEDLIEFDLEKYIYGLCIGDDNGSN